MNPRPPLLAGAITTTITATLGTTSLPITGNPDVQRLAIGASIVLWLAWIAHGLAGQHQARLVETRTEVERFQSLTVSDGLLRAAAGGNIQPTLDLPRPHGQVQPASLNLDGQTVLVGLDEDATLADVTDIQDAVKRARP